MSRYPPAVVWRYRWERFRRAVLVTVSLALAGAVIMTPQTAMAADSVVLEVQIDGRSLAGATESRPISLRPDQSAVVALRVTNRASAPIEVRRVRVAGRVMGLTFFAFDTSVALAVAPGATEDRQYSLDLGDLDSQATGLILGSVTVFGAGGTELASQRTVVDVRGALRSVYGIFGLVVAGLTLTSFGVAILALARHRLPQNRWRRALRFLTPGLGLGLSIVFTLSALRVFVPRPGRWIPILLISVAVFFAIGYMTPSPEDDALEDGTDGGDGHVGTQGVVPTGTSSRRR